MEWDEKLRPQIAAIMGEGWCVQFLPHFETGAANTIRIRIFASESWARINFENLEKLSVLLRTKNINLCHELGFHGTDVTPAEPHETTIWVRKPSA